MGGDFSVKSQDFSREGKTLWIKGGNFSFSPRHIENVVRNGPPGKLFPEGLIKDSALLERDIKMHSTSDVIRMMKVVGSDFKFQKSMD